MYTFIIVIHVFVCFVLIAVILLQAGRGGGMSDMAGGQPQSILGTQTNTFMTRATEVCAIVFIITSLSLGIISTQRGKSLLEKRRLLDALKKNVPGAAQTTSPKADAAGTAPTAPAAAEPKAAEPAKPEPKLPAGANAQ